MVDHVLPPLSEWENFYVITGSAAAGLTGLMFVVVALRSEARADDAEAGFRAFGSPTVVHFCGVLLLASIVSIPGHTIASLGVCVGAAGLAGLGISAWVAAQVRRQTSYAMVVSDWIWHIALPFVAYSSVVASAIALWWYPDPALHGIAAAALLLLFIGIHNAWDAAVWIVVRRE